MCSAVRCITHRVSPDSSLAFIGNARGSSVTRVVVTQDSVSASELALPTAAGPNGMAVALGAGVRMTRGVVRVGLPLVLSGSKGASSRQLLMGYELALEVVNAHGGVLVRNKPKRLQLCLAEAADDTAIPEVAERLISDEHCALLLGPYSTGTNAALKPVINARRVPTVTAGGAGATLYDAGNKFLFGVLPDAGYLKATLAALLDAQVSIRSVLGITSPDPAAQQDLTETIAMATSKGIRSLGTVPLTDLTDTACNTAVVAAQEKAKAAGQLDLLLVASNPAGCVGVVAACKAHNFAPAGIAVSTGLGDPTNVELYHEPFILGAVTWLPQQPGRAEDYWGCAANFNAAFKDRYHVDASPLAVAAAAAVTTLASAVRTAGVVEPTAVAASLHQTDVATCFGRVKFGDHGHNTEGQVFPVQNLPGTQGCVAQILTPSSLVWPFPGWDADAASFNLSSMRGLYWFYKQGGAPQIDCVGTMIFDGKGGFGGGMTYIDASKGIISPMQPYAGTYTIQDPVTGRGGFEWKRPDGSTLTSHTIPQGRQRSLITQVFSNFDEPVDEVSKVMQGRVIIRCPIDVTPNQTPFGNSCLSGDFWLLSEGNAGDHKRQLVGNASFNSSTGAVVMSFLVIDAEQQQSLGYNANVSIDPATGCGELTPTTVGGTPAFVTPLELLVEAGGRLEFVRVRLTFQSPIFTGDALTTLMLVRTDQNSAYWLS